MRGRVFFDTNVLVYAYDRSEPRKQQRAAEVLAAFGNTGRGAISTQVLAELFVTLTRKIPAPLSANEASERLSHYLQSWPVLDLTGAIVLESCRAVLNWNLSFWDAQIWATARSNGIPTIFSEDFSQGSVLGGIGFVNPFLPEFRLAAWLG
jgi:predicted nucleic acid-binding protein